MEDEPVVADVVVEAGTGRGRRTVLRLSGAPHDPLAVTLTLTAVPDHPALPRGSWVVLRDFLRYGMEEATGDGVVRIRPDEEGDCVLLSLARAGRPAAVAVPREAVREFLDRTERVVATGAEASDAAIDALLARLLGEEPPAR